MRHVLEKGAHEMGLDISGRNIQDLELYVTELKRWNRTVNLTAITSDTEIAIKHIIDSLILAAHIHGGEGVLDMGSGAGIPAIPLKIVQPETRVTSVDAVAKKIHFQRHVARLLRLREFQALHARVEALRQTHAHGFDVIVSRAFTNLGRFASLAAPLMAKEGRMIAMKGPAASGEIAEATPTLKELGLEIVAIYPYTLPFNSGERCLITIKSNFAS